MKECWKRAAIVFISVSIVMTCAAGILFIKSDYYPRLITKMGFGGGYYPDSRESYLIKSWSGSLDDFHADVVFLGDSITAGGEWDEYFPKRTVCKLAVPGDSIEQILYRVDMVDQLNPSKVFLLAGVNNVSRLGYEDTIRERYGLLLEKLSGYGCEIYIQSILPVREPSKVSNDNIIKANEIIRELAKDYDVTYIDIAPLFTDETDHMKEELTRDGIHLNDSGYEVWVEFIRQYVEE